MKLILEAYAKSEYGEGPSWAVVELTQEFVNRVEHLMLIAKEHNLQSVTVAKAPDEWDQEDELRLRGYYLTVWGPLGTFWFSAYPKHADYEVETRSMNLASLKKALMGESDDESVVEGPFVFQNETVKEAYTEYLAEQVPVED